MSLNEGDKDHVREVIKATENHVLNRTGEPTADFARRMIDSFEAHFNAKMELAKLAGTCVRCDKDIPPGGRQLIHPITGEVKFSALCSECGPAVTKMMLERLDQRRQERARQEAEQRYNQEREQRRGKRHDDGQGS